MSNSPLRFDGDGLDPEQVARGAELVERALHASAGSLDEQDEAAELQRFFSDCRGALRGADDARDSDRLVARVLGATTREDLSVRGDMRLLGGWLADALRGSLLVRVAAASLLVHIFAVPVVAAILLLTHERKGPARITFAPLPEDPFLAPDDMRDSGLELDLLPDDVLFAELGSAAPDPLAVSNALRRARWSLTHGGAPGASRPGAALDATDPLERALARRAEALAARDWSALRGLSGLPAAVGGEGGLAAVVWLETQLDRFALTGEIAPQWAGALVAMDLAAAGPLATLERDALARASDYGLLDSSQRERWAEPVTRARSETPRALPVDRDWLLRLADCLPSGAARGPELRAWLAWRPAIEPAR